MQIVKRDFANFDVFPDPPKRVTVHLLTSWNSCVHRKLRFAPLEEQYFLVFHAKNACLLLVGDLIYSFRSGGGSLRNFAQKRQTMQNRMHSLGIEDILSLWKTEIIYHIRYHKSYFFSSLTMLRIIP